MNHISCQISTDNGTSRNLGVLITDGEFGEKGHEHVLVVEKSLRPGTGIAGPSQLALIKTNSGGVPVYHPFELTKMHCSQGLYSYDIAFI